jgi:hypothetical protein
MLLLKLDFKFHSQRKFLPNQDLRWTSSECPWGLPYQLKHMLEAWLLKVQLFSKIQNDQKMLQKDVWEALHPFTLKSYTVKA